MNIAMQKGKELVTPPGKSETIILEAAVVSMLIAGTPTPEGPTVVMEGFLSCTYWHPGAC